MSVKSKVSDLITKAPQMLEIAKHELKSTKLKDTPVLNLISTNIGSKSSLAKIKSLLCSRATSPYGKILHSSW